jgi:DNA invertase Pin-like site-specific DNA recombinase
MRAALYARVSTEEQTEGYSIDAQRRAFQTLCQGRGWIPCREYIEEGKSARTENINKRPVFKQMMSDAEMKQFDVLVCHKLDRFSRNLRITLEYFEKLSKAGIAFTSISEQMDFSQPWGKFALAMLGAMAQFYSDNLSHETKKGWSERKAQGLYCGLLPFGAKKGEDGVPVPNPETYPGLVLAFELAAQGKSDREIAVALNAKGYRTAGNQGNGPFGKDTVRDIVQNRFYLGELPDGKGGWIKAKHEPFVSGDLFNTAQIQRANRRRAKNGSIRHKATTFSLSGLSKCGICKSTIAVHQTKQGKPRIYCRGRAKGLQCNCKGTFLEIYEAQIHWYLENFVIPQDYREKILEAHRKLENAYNDTERCRAQLQNRLLRLQEQYEWSHITKDEYLDKHNQIRRELSALTPVEASSSNLDRLAHFLENVADAWKEATQEQRNKLSAALFERIIIEHDRVVGVKPREELRPFFQLSYEESLKKYHVPTRPPSGSHENLYCLAVKVQAEEGFQFRL